MHENILIAYGRAILGIRQKSNISQEELDDLSGLHRTYVSDIELGKRNVSLENIAKLAEALQMKKSDIFIEVERIEDALFDETLD